MSHAHSSEIMTPWPQSFLEKNQITFYALIDYLQQVFSVCDNMPYTKTHDHRSETPIRIENESDMNMNNQSCSWAASTVLKK